MPRFDIADFQMDPVKKVDGVWIDFGGEAEFKIASLSNPEFQKAFAAKKAPYDKMRKELTEDQMLDVMVFCLARYVVLDWKNVFENDVEISYSVEKAEEILMKVEWLRDRVIEESRDLSNFAEKVTEEIEKNLLTASDGS